MSQITKTFLLIKSRKMIFLTVLTVVFLMVSPGIARAYSWVGKTPVWMDLLGGLVDGGSFGEGHIYRWGQKIDFSPQGNPNDSFEIPPPANGTFWYWWHDCDSFVAGYSGGSVATLNAHCGGSPASWLTAIDGGWNWNSPATTVEFNNIALSLRINQPGTYKEHLCLGYGQWDGSTMTPTSLLTCKTQTLTICPDFSVGSGSCPTPTPTPTTPTPTPTPTATPGTLVAALSTTPETGDAPLWSKLKATGTGTETGTSNYTFWYDCDKSKGGGNSVVNTTSYCGDPTRYGEKHDGVVGRGYTTALHQFYSPGTYHVKVIIERGSATPDDAYFDLIVTSPTVYTLDITSLTANPSTGVQPLNPSLTINYESDHAGPWDVYVYCKNANRNADLIYLNRPDANVGSAPGHSPPWFSGSISIPPPSSGAHCSYTDNTSGAITLRVVMKNPANPAMIFDSATVNLDVQLPTYELTIDANGTGPSAAISVREFKSNQPAGVTMRYTMYCDRNDTSTTVTNGWNTQVSSTDRTNVPMGACNYAAFGTYYPKVIVEYPLETPAVLTPVVQANTTYTYSSPHTLAASLSASPNPGVVNRSIVLTGTRSNGSATGNISYKFYCKDTDANPAATFTTSATAQHTDCVYAATGTYKAKLVLVQEGITSQALATVTVTNASVSAALEAIPASTTINNPVSLKATTSGNADGDITYDFYCLETDSVYKKRVTSTLTSVQVDSLCSYTAVGSKKAKVIVSREGQTATAVVTITISALGSNGQIIFEADGVAIKIRGSLVADQVVFAPRDKGNQQFSARIYSDKNILASRLPGFSDIMSIINQNQ